MACRRSNGIITACSSHRKFRNAEGEPDSFLQVIPTLGLLALAGVIILGLRTRVRA